MKIKPWHIVTGAAVAAFLFWPRRASGASSSFYSDDKPGEFFTWEEVTTTNTGLPNDIPEQYRVNAALLAQLVLDPIRRYIDMPLNVSSWYRSPAVNEEVGGSPESKHTEALAADIDTGSDRMNVAIMRAAIALNLPFDQLIAYGSWDAPTRVHVDFGGEDDPRREVGLKTGAGYTWITLEQAAAKYL